MDACARRSVSGSEFWREDPRRCFSSDCEQDSRFAASTQECQTGLWSREPEAETDRNEELAAGGTRRSPPGMASAGRFAAWRIWLKGGTTASQQGGGHLSESGRFKLNAPSRVL